MAAWAAHEPPRYLSKLAAGLIAFGAALKVESIFVRLFALVWLLINGGMFLLTGISQGAVVDIVLGLASWSGAAYAWWFCRYE